MSDREAFLRRFHAARPGITSAALGHTESYDRLVAAVPAGVRVLDLGCGDGHLVRRFPDAIGVDLAPAPGAEEAGGGAGLVAVGKVAGIAPPAPLAGEVGGIATPAQLVGGAGRAPRLVAGRAQALPFADRTFGACVCHLAFMLFNELDTVVAELRRVVVPGGTFAAVLGGGPTADGDDAFHRFLALARPSGPSFGDRRARSPEGWRSLFQREASFTRFEVDLSGPFDQVWRFLGASYQLADPEPVRSRLRAGFFDRIVDRTAPPFGGAAGRGPPSVVCVPCRVVMWLATVAL